MPKRRSGTAKPAGKPQASVERRDGGLRGFLAAAAIFGASRLVMFMGVAFSLNYVKPNPAPGLWNVGTLWWRYLLRFDSAYYLDIAQQGYNYDGNPMHMQSIVFFPGYPVLARAVAMILGVSVPFGSILVSNLCTFAAILLLYDLIRRTWDKTIALTTVAVLSLFPTSLFLSAGYSEGTALLLTVAVFWFLSRDRLALAVVCAGLVAGTRPVGFVAAIPLIYEVWLRTGKRISWQFTVRAVGVAVTATSGLLTFMMYCWVRFHDPLVFVHARAAWREAGGLPGGVAAFRQLGTGILHPELLSEPNFNDGWFFLLFLGVTVLLWRRFPMALNLYSAASFLVLITTRVLGEPGFISMNRYLLLLFPSMAGVALLIQRRVWLIAAMAGVLGALLVMYSAMFAQWLWAG